MFTVLSRHPKAIAWFFVSLLYLELLTTSLEAKAMEVPFHHMPRDVKRENGNLFSRPLPTKVNPIRTAASAEVTGKNLSAVFEKEHRSVDERADIGGPTQPEMQSFQSVNASNMVDLFSGDFSYNIPLMDVGGYPVNLGYSGGISMDQEASWVGLGWNINPGTITRNMRGLPDDFSGADSVKKINSIRENKTVGVTAGAGSELTGLPLSVGEELGIFHNNYRGWGLERSFNVSINSGSSAKGPLSGGLSITNNTQEGLTLTPSLSYKLGQIESDASGAGGNVSMSLPYNSRSGVKALQLSAGVRQYGQDLRNLEETSAFGSSFNTAISFASPSFTPSMTIPYTSRQFSFTGKVGNALKVFDGNLSISGYVSKQRIDAADTLLALPSYGYLHFQEGARNNAALLDFNREKELPYREKPAVPHIAVPGYTYDAFSITGEGVGGMFRPYRGDIGFVYDHYMTTKDESDRLSLDLGLGDLVHAGVDLNVNRAYTQNSAWRQMNPMAKTIAFKKSSGAFEAVYFRNPGEKAINSKQFYEAIGGDDVVAVDLYQPGPGSSLIQTTNSLTRYRDKQSQGRVSLTPQTAFKKERDKRTQVISYLTAKEAAAVGLFRYIDNYSVNQFSLSTCGTADLDKVEGEGTGLPAEYYRNTKLQGTPETRTDAQINIAQSDGTPPYPGFIAYNYSVRWSGRIKAPVEGPYRFITRSDDGVRMWLNDSLVINHWDNHGPSEDTTKYINFVKGEMARIRVEYFQGNQISTLRLDWEYLGQSRQTVPITAFYGSAKDTFQLNSYLAKENRINQFRKENHISEIDVLNSDGRRYVYGIPVYNLKQREASFAVNSEGANKKTGLVRYTHGTDNSTRNTNGKDWYYNSELMPAYAHSFLLTGILSPDYVDLTGNGISDDDPGDAVKFNYSKTAGIANPYQWRAPYVTDSVTYNEGLKTDNRDDKGNYVYGEKELWYLHSIESKTMIATFTLEERLDLPAITEAGGKYRHGAKRLKEIKLYSKADFLKNPATARPVKTVHFEYTYELCKGVNRPLNDTGKLTLKKVWFTYNDNKKGQQNPYVFHYSSNNPNYNIKSYDRWGNYKDPLQNPGSTPSDLIGNDEYPYALQDSSLAAYNSAAWTLDSIYLPSGGSMKMDFESDDYAYVQNKRAMQMFKLLGFGPNANMASGYSHKLYENGEDNLYAYISVPVAVSSKKDVYAKYLSDLKKLYFRLSVRMPSDNYGSGYESIPCYANLEENGYGMVNANTIWVKMSGISLKGDESGSYSPLAKCAIQFLRLNLPSKAYPGSEVGTNIDLKEAIMMMYSMASNVITSFMSFDRTARIYTWGSSVDLNRTYIRLNNPAYRKFGGGHRVKRITIYDNWDKMTNQRAATYGQEYTYTTKKEIDGVSTIISSGVASYEPSIGNDENPFRQPIEYIEQVAPLAPVSLGYSEEPLGESFYPSAGVGYSQVRVRSIHYKDKKSANGYTETQFYTAYDFPTYTDRTMLDDATKKRYKPGLANFLRVDARYHLALSQGFKIELNDMHGKLRSQAVYAETDPNNYVTYTENIYKVENPSADQKRLSNVVMAMHPDGTIDSSAIIGKDVELMVDMRQQLSVTNGHNISINSELFTIPLVPPVFMIPTLLNLAQREENLFRSVATLKVVQRYGILDSVISIDKGSRVVARDLLYDSETGDVLLKSTRNEFNDPVYSFTYPSHWAYDGMGLAYKNIDVVLGGISIRDGRITSALSTPDSLLFSGGDEILVGGKQKTGGTICADSISTFPSYRKIWVVDSSLIRNQGPKTFYFINEDGSPYTGSNISLKIVRSGRRNQLGSVGAVTSLENPLVRNSQTGQYEVVLNSASRVINTSAAEYKQAWKVAEVKKQKTVATCNGQCNCLKPFFDYLISAQRLLTEEADHITVRSLVTDAISAGFAIDTASCSIIRNNLNGLFFEDTANVRSGGSIVRLGELGETIYRAKIGNCTVGLKSAGEGFNEMSLYYLSSLPCQQNDTIHYSLTPKATVCSTYVLNYRFNQESVSDPSAAIHMVLLPIASCNNSPGTGVSMMNLPLRDTSIQFCAPPNPHVEIWCLSNLQGIDYSWTVTALNDTTCADFQDQRPVNAVLEVESCPGLTCDTVYSKLCYNPVTDTTLNPYLYGVLGNWRGHKSYVYYGSRAESDPTAATNIRKNGTFSEFTPFWAFQSGRLQPQYDSSRWVWNSEMTLFNAKGLEIENKDPLGRYNAGVYGYNQTMPTAVIQNSRYRESAFEGFEDYGYGTQACDTACPAKRHFDFGAHAHRLDTTQRHSGKSSLRLEGHETAAVSVGLEAQGPDDAYLSLSTQVNSCGIDGALVGIYAPSNILLPTFSPTKGKRMLISAWVREEQDCKCASYTSNRIVVNAGGQSYSFKPSGSIIEGWQRCEAVFDLDSDATILTVSLEATGSSAVYFDDLRIHPFNANMKSFVFHPVNLRLMAELDENNFATFYEYDDEGTLIRTKKETQRGIKTITETRSALKKDD